MALLYFSDVFCDPCTLISMCSQWCEETCSLSVISNAGITGEWRSCFSVASCHLKHDPFWLSPDIKWTSPPPRSLQVRGATGSNSSSWLWCLAYVRDNGRMLLKTPMVGLGKRKEEKENIFSWIICLTPLELWNIKEHLPVPSSREKCQKSACPLQCALKSGRIGRCYSPHASQRPAFAQTSPISAQRKGQRAFSPSALTHYRSSWQTPQMAKFSTLYSPCGYVLHKAVCHTQQHPKGVNW